MGFRHEDFKFRFVEATRLSPIVGFHSRFRWFSLRRPCGAFIVPTEEENSRIILIYFQGRGKTREFLRKTREFRACRQPVVSALVGPSGRL